MSLPHIQHCYLIATFSTAPPCLYLTYSTATSWPPSVLRPCVPHIHHCHLVVTFRAASLCLYLPCSTATLWSPSVLRPCVCTSHTSLPPCSHLPCCVPVSVPPM
ncbi:hypothetical protein FKM82_025000 [Ascaphus truei]